MYRGSNESWYTLKEMILEKCKDIKGEKSSIKATEQRFIQMIAPKNFYSIEGNDEVKYILDFENMCHGLREHSPSKDIKKMNVVEMYSLIGYVKEKVKNSNKNGRKV